MGLPRYRTGLLAVGVQGRLCSLSQGSLPEDSVAVSPESWPAGANRTPSPVSRPLAVGSVEAEGALLRRGDGPPGSGGKRCVEAPEPLVLPCPTLGQGRAAQVISEVTVARPQGRHASAGSLEGTEALAFKDNRAKGAVSPQVLVPLWASSA